MAKLSEQEQQQIIRVQNVETGEWEEQWTIDYIFENECPPGRRKVAIKVVDIFGNDTMTIVEVGV